jgi:hypothetical protein
MSARLNALHAVVRHPLSDERGSSRKSAARSRELAAADMVWEELATWVAVTEIWRAPRMSEPRPPRRGFTIPIAPAAPPAAASPVQITIT